MNIKRNLLFQCSSVKHFIELDDKSVSEVVCHSLTAFPFRAYFTLTEKWYMVQLHLLNNLEVLRGKGEKSAVFQRVLDLT